jgi:hypothetical protein
MQAGGDNHLPHAPTNVPHISAIRKLPGAEQVTMSILPGAG